MSDQEDARMSGIDGKKEPSKRRCGDGDDWWHDRSLPVKILMGIGFGILGIGFGALIVLVVMSLWNWLMPEIFGLKTITYWQSFGLMLLSFILFKNWGSGSSDGGKRGDRRRKRELRRHMRRDGNGGGNDGGETASNVTGETADKKLPGGAS